MSSHNVQNVNLIATAYGYCFRARLHAEKFHSTLFIYFMHSWISQYLKWFFKLGGTIEMNNAKYLTNTLANTYIFISS